MKQLLGWVGMLFGLVVVMAIGMLSHLRQEPSEAYWIALVNYDKADFSRLYLTTSSGMSPIQITHDTYYYTYPLWSPDGRWLFATRWENHPERIVPELVQMRANGSQAKLISRPAGESLNLVWSADGQWLYIARFEPIPHDPFNNNRDIWRMRPDGSDAQNLTQTTNSNEWLIGLAADDGWLVYMEYGNRGEVDIWRMRPDGSQRENLTQTPEQGENVVRLSPDGQWLSFLQANRDLTDIYVLSLADNHLTALPPTPNLYEQNAEWSPDGQWLYYDAHSTTSPTFDLYRSRLDGSASQRLTDITGDEFFIGWSPDGDWLWFVRYENGTADLYRLNPTSGDMENLTESPASTCCYSLSADEEWLYYIELRYHGKAALYRMRPDGSHKQIVIEQKVSQNFEYSLSPIYDYPLAVGAWGLVGGGLVANVLGLGVWLSRRRRN